MTLQRGRGKLRPATSRPDELPTGVAAPRTAATGPLERDANGKIASSEAAREMGRRSGQARAQKSPKRWGARLGLGTLLSDPLLGEESLFRPFLDDADRWFRAKVEELSSTIGGGVASAGVCSIIRTAAMERAFSAYFFEMSMTKAFAFARGSSAEGKTGAKFDVRVDLAQVASKLGDSSRQNLLAAHELCAREAMARKSAPASTSNALAERVEKLIEIEQANAQRWRNQLAEKPSTSTTVDASVATDTRGSVAVPPVPTRTTDQNVPVREQTPVAPGAPVPPIRMSDEERLRQLCKEWLEKSPRRTIEDSKRINEIQSEAGGIISGRYSRDQREEDRWLRSQRRGRLNVVPFHVPHPAASWWASYHQNEADYAKRVFGWQFEEEPR